MRQWRLEMEKQERADLEQKNSRRPPPRSDSTDHNSPVRTKSKFSNLRRTDRERVVRKLDDDFRLEEEDDEEEPLTPAEALISAQDYLSRAKKSRKGKPDRNTSIALQIIKDAITASAPKKSSTRRQTRERTPDRDPSSPDDDDNDSSDDRRKRSGKNKKHDSDKNNRHRSTRQDARDDITQNKVNRSRRRRAAREEYLDEEASDEEIKPCGALCFTRAIHETRIPNGFKLNSTTLKYN